MSTPVNNNKGDIFHVIHKVPSGDSPYVRAKHIQLVDKDPSRAVSLFWAAINAGDRVDSALKDMAVVMKQLDRSDEAVEAVKSFRHLCPYDSQESLDNVLIELYKRSGRVEEEIELLQNKLKNIEEGIAFGGAKTKMARSQGKKIQITIKQERSRILGNLAWAYMQQNKFEMAEQYYRKALSLGVDKNKQCNLAICLMHMNRMTEAKSLLQAVKVSAGNRQMDSSYARSFERAIQMLTELESPSDLKPAELEVGDDQKNKRPFALPDNGKTNPQVTCSTSEGQNHHVSTFSVCRSLANGHDEETVLLNEQDRTAYSRNLHENKHSFFGCDKGSLKFMSSGPTAASQFSAPMFVNNRRKGSYLGNSYGKSGCASTMKKNCGSSPGIGVSSAHQETHVSPAAIRRNLEVLFTQPRRPFREFSDGEQRKDRWGPIGSSNTNQSSEKTLHTYSTVLFTQPRRSSSHEHDMEDQTVAKWREKPFGSSIRKLTFEQTITGENDQAHAIPIVNGKLLVPTKDESKIGLPNSKNSSPSPTSKDWTRRSWEDTDQVKDEPVKQHLQPAVDGDSKSICWKTDGFALTKHITMESGLQNILDEMQEMNTCGNGDDRNKLALEGSNSATTLPTGLSGSVDNTVGGLFTSVGDQSIDNNSDILQQCTAERTKSSQDCFTIKDKKSWADMVEEDENEEQDENLNSNIVYPSSCAQNQIDYLSQKLEDSFDPKDGYAASRNLKARRSLCFDQQQSPEQKVRFYSSPLPNKGLKFDNSAPGTMRINRLQVFQDITPFPDSP